MTARLGRLLRALSGWRGWSDRGSVPGMTTATNPYRGFRYPAEVIEHAFWLYHCFSLSLRDVKLILAARGVVAPTLPSPLPVGHDGCARARCCRRPGQRGTSTLTAVGQQSSAWISRLGKILAANSRFTCPGPNRCPLAVR